ncbi:MAG: hypothetical protein V5A38_01145 [Halolamina sp.]|uniref:hypothetical protein n=1 Tax=Halolamina sp. TaxID=1940283 RepID=UPI002FC35549
MSTWLELRQLIVADREIQGFTHLGSDSVGAIAVIPGLVLLAVPFVPYVHSRYMPLLSVQSYS